MRVDARRRRVRELVDGGASYREAARIVGVSPATVVRDLRAGSGPERVDALPEPLTAPDGDAGPSVDDLDSLEGVNAAILRLYRQIEGGEVTSRDAGLRLRILFRNQEALSQTGEDADRCREHVSLDTLREAVERINREWVFHTGQIVHDLHWAAIAVRDVSAPVIEKRIGLVRAALERGGDDG